MKFFNQALITIINAIQQNLALSIILIALLVLSWVLWLTRASSAPLRGGKAMLAALITAAIGFFALPALFHSGIGELNYWLDWAFHITSVIVLFVFSYLVFLPFFSWLGGKR